MKKLDPREFTEAERLFKAIHPDLPFTLEETEGETVITAANYKIVRRWDDGIFTFLDWELVYPRRIRATQDEPELVEDICLTSRPHLRAAVRDLLLVMLDQRIYAELDAMDNNPHTLPVDIGDVEVATGQLNELRKAGLHPGMMEMKPGFDDPIDFGPDFT